MMPNFRKPRRCQPGVHISGGIAPYGIQISAQQVVAISLEIGYGKVVAIGIGHPDGSPAKRILPVDGTWVAVPALDACIDGHRPHSSQATRRGLFSQCRTLTALKPGGGAHAGIQPKEK